MGTFWVYARIQSMVFLVGIVGPIFLIIYFATQPDPTIKWMYYWGLVITAIDVLVALVLTQQAIADRTPATKHANDSEGVM
jgi:uncharacterized membrane protein